MKEEPRLSNPIYEEIRECEEYALLNLITFEAAIRNARVIEILNQLDSASSEDQLDAMLSDDNKYVMLKRELRDEYFLDYETYRDYISRRGLESSKSLSDYKKELSYTLHTDHNDHAAHTHYTSLPLYRPKMYIPQKDSAIRIEIPMYHIHLKDIKAYYKRLMEKHQEVITEAKEYYTYEELFYDEVNETKSKAETYAQMFFVWDFMEWWKEKNGTFTPDETARTVYLEIAEIIGAAVNDTTGRSPKIEKYLEEMNNLISKCGYKKFYTPHNE